ncbi:MAG: fused DSP-PTPase phosphatase/NAD kinase-like protein [Desulfomonilaceae bacterium]
MPGKLAAGCYPGSKHPDEARRKLRGLLDCGIRFVINLMTNDEKDHDGDGFVPYEEGLEDMAIKLGVELKIARMPITDNSVPSEAQLQEILSRIDSSVNRGRPVYVHCWGGHGRTGTVVGCYLSRHGIAKGPAALERIERLRTGQKDPTADKPSPQTEAQRKMVRLWTEPGIRNGNP